MTRTGSILGILRWPVAAAAILAAHLALANWLMASSELGDRTDIPQPIFVDLQPAPQPEPAPAPPPAPESEPEPEPEAAPEAQPQPEPQAAPQPEPVEAASFAPPPPQMSLPPLADPADLFPPITSALALAESSRPQTKPRPRPRREVEPAAQSVQTEPRRQAAPAATAQKSPAPTAPAPAAPAAQAARRQPAPAGPGPREIANWQAQIGARIIRHMGKTNVSGRGQLSVQIAVAIGPNGAAQARLVSSTGDARTDQALARQAGRMPRMPAPPGGQPQSFVLPVMIQAR